MTDLTPLAKKDRPKTREEWLGEFTRLARPTFKAAGSPLPKTVRCSVGFPSKGSKSKVIGECWSTEVSADKITEIFLRPSLQSDTSRIADVLTHELCHAALGLEAGHGPLFKKLAHAVGLEGKMTATTAGKGWHAWADPIIKHLGPLPGASLDDKAEIKGGKKKQTTRMIKVSCDQCDWSCRTTAIHIHDGMRCPLVDCDGELSPA